jgi:hypothetical protein
VKNLNLSFVQELNFGKLPPLNSTQVPVKIKALWIPQGNLRAFLFLGIMALNLRELARFHPGKDAVSIAEKASICKPENIKSERGIVFMRQLSQNPLNLDKGDGRKTRQSFSKCADFRLN